MKNIALVIALILTLAACSSGTTIGEVPPTITGLYKGEFTSLNDRDSGTMIMNLAQSTEGKEIGGTLQFVYDKQDPTCLANTTISGTVDGFSVRLEAEFTGTSSSTTDEDGKTTTTTESGGTVTFQLTANDNTLFGTYVTSGGNACSNYSGSGNVTIKR